MHFLLLNSAFPLAVISLWMWCQSEPCLSHTHTHTHSLCSADNLCVWNEGWTDVCVISQRHANTRLGLDRFCLADLIASSRCVCLASCCGLTGGSCWRSVCFSEDSSAHGDRLNCVWSSRVSPTSHYLPGRAGVDAQCTIFSSLCGVAVPSEADGSLCHCFRHWCKNAVKWGCCQK